MTITFEQWCEKYGWEAAAEPQKRECWEAASRSRIVPNPDSSVTLSPRERDVLVLASKGFRAGEVAKLLDISVRSVNGQLANVYRKLDVHTKVEAAVWAAKAGWV